jgi:hypothetical protein
MVFKRPLNLFKANAELQLRIAQLMRESGHRWLAAAQSSAAGISETTAELQSVLRCRRLAITGQPARRAFMRRLEDRMSDAKSASDIAIKNQAGFCQRSAAGPGGLAKICGRGPACRQRAQSARFAADIFKQWLSAWTPATQDPAQAKSGEAAQK